MNGGYHNEMLVYSREYNQYNKAVIAYGIGENCWIIHCQGFLVVSYLKNTNGTKETWNLLMGIWVWVVTTDNNMEIPYTVVVSLFWYEPRRKVTHLLNLYLYLHCTLLCQLGWDNCLGPHQLMNLYLYVKYDLDIIDIFLLF